MCYVLNVVWCPLVIVVVVCCLVCVVCCLLFVGCCLLLADRGPMFAGNCVLVGVCRLLFVVMWWLFAVLFVRCCL